ncbi:MAG: hypothetical protein P8R42_25020 [Candidatus Binatia bacterium]|nr:hypothetical protein [Candidatus Binatia bacterium]
MKALRHPHLSIVSLAVGAGILLSIGPALAKDPDPVAAEPTPWQVSPDSDGTSVRYVPMHDHDGHGGAKGSKDKGAKKDAKSSKDTKAADPHAGHKAKGSSGLAPGIYEVTRFPDAKPTTEQKAAAQAFAKRSLEAAKAKGWFDYQKALADGFSRRQELDRLHYANDEFLADDEELNPERPEFLMFYDTPKGKKLAGIMYLADTQEGHGEQIGGPLTLWHYHQWPRPSCWENGLPIGEPSENGECWKGFAAPRSPEMLHVWFLDHPAGDFATDMELTPDLIEKLAENDLGSASVAKPAADIGDGGNAP